MAASMAERSVANLVGEWAERTAALTAALTAAWSVDWMAVMKEQRRAV